MRSFVVLLFLSLPFLCPAQAVNPVVENIFQRKSVRTYKNIDVSRDTLDILVRAGMAAPTARNLQPWHFVVLTDKELKNRLASELPYAKMLSNAPAAIIVFGDPEKSSLWMYDCSAATENILLAAESMGLGAVWTAAYPYEDRINAVMSVLSVPEQYLPLCVIPLGYPDRDNAPKDKWNPERVHYNGW